MTSLINVDIELKFPKSRYRGFLRKLKTFMTYCATVGIHKTEGLKSVTRSYSKRINKNNYTSMYKQYRTIKSGRSHKMTLVKLAYQNEFGTVSYGGKFPDIRIKPRYRIKKVTTQSVYHTPRTRVTVKQTRTMSVERKASEQGYLLLSRTGDFVMYKKPGEVIGIPPRPFLTKVVDNPPPTLSYDVASLMANCITGKGKTVASTYRSIAQLVTDVAKNNIDKPSISNHPLTVKAKGFDKALYDTNNRIRESIKYKIWKNPDVIGSPANIRLSKQMTSYYDELLDKANQYEKTGVINFSTTENIFRYKRLNPNYRGNYHI